MKKKIKTREQIEQALEDKKRMWNVFMEIWKERPHYSQISGKWLGNEPATCMFDHLLEKNEHPVWKYEKENIILITCEEHQRRTNGWPLEKHERAIEKAKQKFLYGAKLGEE